MWTWSLGRWVVCVPPSPQPSPPAGLFLPTAPLSQEPSFMVLGRCRQERKMRLDSD